MQIVWQTEDSGRDSADCNNHTQGIESKVNKHLEAAESNKDSSKHKCVSCLQQTHLEGLLLNSDCSSG